MKKLITILVVFLCGTAYANDFYAPTGNPANNSPGSSATMRAEFSLIEDGFDKLPTLAGNNNLPVFVNAAGSTMEAISASAARSRLGLVIGTDVQAYDANLPTWPASVDATEVGYLNGVTSGIQDQLDGKASLSSVSASANTNLLINSNFAVNQESYATGVITTGEYGHDMWKSISSASYTLSGSAITMVSGTLGQRNDDMVAADGETVTLSVTAGSLTIGATAGAAATTITSASPYTWTLDMSGSAFLTITAATSADGIKLERGSNQTAYIEPEPRAEEARCYYYYQRVGLGAPYYSTGARGATTLSFSAPLVGKIKPGATCAAVGAAPRIEPGSITVTFTSLQTSDSGELLEVTLSSSPTSLTLGNAYSFTLVNALGYFELDARP